MKKKGKIFLVDDESLIVLSLTTALKKEGYEVVSETRTFTDVVDRIRSSAPDVVLLDIGLRETNGIDILKEVKSGNIDTEVVMLTADETTDTAVKCMKLGATDYLTKPFNLDEVIMVIKNIIEKEGLRREVNHLRNIIKDLKRKTEKTALTYLSTILDRFGDSYALFSQYGEDISHELRTPLNNLMGEAEVALSGERLPDEYRQVLASSLEEYEKLSRVIDNMLFLIREKNTKTRIKRSMIDPLKEIKKIGESYQPRAEKKGIEVQCSGSGSLAADPILFRKALSNLLSDAIAFTPHGGKIEISVQQPDKRPLEITMCEIASEINSDRYYGRRSSDFPQVTGLGLAVVKSIMRLHNGDITMKRDPEKGSVISLLFPSRHTDELQSGGDFG